jgi:tetratricopeptide (TPR) repeat protein
VRQLILAGYPVMIESGYNPEPDTVGWTSHYLTLFGFNDQGFVAMDTYRRPNWFYPYNELDYYWRQFNRRYLVAYRDDQAAAIASIIGPAMDDETMYNNAVYTARTELSLERNDAYGWFNLGSSLVALEQYEDAALAFDQARSIGLEWRFLWYQFEPYEAYMQVGRYQDVIDLANDVLQRKASEEAYYYKGLALQEMGETDDARLQFTFAVRANPNYVAAQEALDRLDEEDR